MVSWIQRRYRATRLEEREPPASVNNFFKYEKKRKRIRKLLRRIQDFTNDASYISQSNVKNIVQALFNISDKLPDETTDFIDINAVMDSVFIISQLLYREKSLSKSYKILKDTISSSSGLIGPIKLVSIETSKRNKDNVDKLIKSDDEIKELQQLCLKLIEVTEFEKLLANDNLVYILYKWRDWSKSNSKYQRFIQYLRGDIVRFVFCMHKFVSHPKKYLSGDCGFSTEETFAYKSFGEFFDLEETKIRLEKLKNEKPSEYERNKKIIDMYLDNFDKPRTVNDV